MVNNSNSIKNQMHRASSVVLILHRLKVIFAVEGIVLSRKNSNTYIFWKSSYLLTHVYIDELKAIILLQCTSMRVQVNAALNFRIACLCCSYKLIRFNYKCRIERAN